MLTQDDYIKMSAEVIQNNIESIVQGVIDCSNDVIKKLKVQFGSAYKSYLKTAIKKHSKIKTILYNDRPVYLYDFYVDINVNNKHEETETKKIENLINISKNILITGTAGCGKSTLMKHLFLNSLDTNKYIPIFIELRRLNKPRTKLMQLIYNTIQTLKFSLEEKYFIQSLNSGKFIFFFDGFDEIDEEIRAEITQEIHDMSDAYSENCFIITSRPDDEFISWNSFTEFKALPLELPKAKQLISNIDYDNEVKQKFIEQLDNLFDEHKSFVSNPLLLTIMLMTFNQYASIPNKLHLFYGQAFETLFCKHDATKGAYKRRIFTNLSIDDFLYVLSCFSTLSYYSRDFSFSLKQVIDYLNMAKKLTNINFREEEFLKDLQKSVCILVKDGLTYTYTHRTFQEYFTALYISKCTKNIQKDLLTKLAKRNSLSINLDKVYEFLFEMDRALFEENFVMPQLIRLNKQLNYSTASKRKIYINLVRTLFNAISIDKRMDKAKSLYSFYYNPTEASVLRITRFLVDKYKPIFGKLDCYVELNGRRIYSEDKQLENQIADYYIGLIPKNKAEYKLNISLKMSDIDYENFVILSFSYIYSFEYAMLLIKKLNIEHQDKEESFNEIISLLTNGEKMSYF